MSVAFGYRNNLMNNTSESSTILLVCIGMDSPGPRFRGLHLEHLFSLLAPFGEVARLLIFSKKAQFKAFAEFVSQEAAALARATLHEAVLDDLGRIRLYFSAMQALDTSKPIWSTGSTPRAKRTSVVTHLSSTRLSGHGDHRLGGKHAHVEEPPAPGSGGARCGRSSEKEAFL